MHQKILKMRQDDEIAPTLPRSSSCKSTTKIIPDHYIRSTSPSLDGLHRRRRRTSAARGGIGITTFLRSLLSFSLLPTCKFLHLPTPSLGRKVTGTLFGRRRGHVSFAVQEDPGSEPVLLMELAISTSALVKEMSSGLVRIAVECEKAAWTMYCNGRKSGYAAPRECTEMDRHVLRTVRSVSVGAGVIPSVEDSRKSAAAEGEMVYMRARFERVVGSRDSEAFYMISPDGNGGPELTVFLLRI